MATTKKPAETDDPLETLNWRQRQFVHYFLGEAHGVAVQAARLAGYAVPEVEGTRVLANVRVRAAIDARVASVAISPDEVLARLSDMATANISEFTTIDKNGRPKVNLKRAMAAGRLHVIKALRPTKYGMSLELHDSQAALEKLGKYYRLFTERHEVTGKDGEPLEIAVEVRQQAAAELIQWRREMNGQLSNGQPSGGKT